MGADLLRAAEIGNIKSFRLALLDGADINFSNIDGTSSLITAVKFNHLELVKFIVSKGVDLFIKDNQGNDVFYYIQHSKNSELKNYFIENGFGNYLEESYNYAIVADELLPILRNVLGIVSQLNDLEDEILIEDFQNIIFLFRQNSTPSQFDILCLGLVFGVLRFPDDFDDNTELLRDTDQVNLLINKFSDFINDNFKSSNVTYDSFEINSLNFKDELLSEKIKNIFFDFINVIQKVNISNFGDDSRALDFISNFLLSNKRNISTNEFNSNHSENSTLDHILDELDSLVGLENIKQDIKSLINIIKINKIRKKEGLPEQKLSLHSVFLGPPGTGKTTIARILSKIYYELQILPKDNCVETDRSGLVAGYVGQTALKTDEIINSALDGVLFIDEAYTLKRNESESDYGQEAIDILLKRMEDNRDNLIVIAAGYEKEMNLFLSSNPGLKSRFNRYFYFRDYQASELTEIYKRLAEKSCFTISENALSKLNELFEVLCSNKDDKFGNARLVRNVFEKTFENHANRTALINGVTRDILTTIEEIDLPFDFFINSSN
jgi:stage V sporulation protein K